MTDTPTCRHCASPLTKTFVDLGTAPPSNSYLTAAQLDGPETYYPLKILTCETCWLVQTQDFTNREEFFSEDYAYLSSASSSWVEHARVYVADMIDRYGLGKDAVVAEVASNDGYLLKHVQDAGIGCYGIEPTTSTADIARGKGIDVVEDFFGRELATKLAGEGRQVDLTAANNVLAHVPDINDFAGGFAILLKDHGVSTFEFPHLLNLVEKCEFDTIYHEHYSYLSLIAVQRIFAENGLQVFDVEELPTHGGSLRVHAQRSDTVTRAVTPAVTGMIERETAIGMATWDYYADFQEKVSAVRDAAMTYLIEARQKGLRVAAYGAAAKGNTFLNFCGVKRDLIDFVCDRAELKQGKYMPGSRIPILKPEALYEAKPDRILILPWNIQGEIAKQLADCEAWGAKFVTFIPGVQEFSSAELQKAG